MRHDPEREAAAYVSGAMRARRVKRFEAHLLACEDCWSEVRDGRLGRSVAESARELAPHELRERIRATIAAADPVTPQRHLRVPIAAGIIALAIGAAALLPVIDGGGSQPEPIAAAVADFVNGRMVADSTPRSAAPDLTGTPFRLAYTGSGTLHGQAVDAFMYKDDTGRRVLIYRSEEPFPVPPGATMTDENGPWRAMVDGIALLCSSEPHAILALADDPAALDDLAQDMGIDA